MRKTKIITLASLILGMVMPFCFTASRAEAAGEDIVINETNFKDEVFRTRFVKRCDTNKDGKLSYTERTTTTVCDTAGFGGVSTLAGIEYFPNINELYIPEGAFTKLDVSGMKNLKSLNLYDCDSLVELTLPSNIEELYLKECEKLTKCDLSNLPYLKKLDMTDDSSFSSVDLKKSISRLEEVILWNTAVKKLDLSKQIYLKKIDVNYTPIEELILPQIPPDGPDGEVYFTGFPLESLEASHCDNLQSLDLRNFDQLKKLQYSYDEKLKTIFLPHTDNCIELYGFYVNHYLLVDGRQCSFNVTDSNTSAGGTSTEAIYIRTDDQLGWYRSPWESEITETLNKYFYIEEVKDEEGRILQFHTGWLTVDGRTYYLTEDGLATGARKIDGETYLFTWIDSATAYTYIDPDSKKSLGKRTLVNPIDVKEGEYAFGQMITGWFGYIAGSDQTKAMYFGDDGKMVSGWKKIDGKDYYFAKSDENTFFIGAPKNHELLSVIECGYTYYMDGKLETFQITITIDGKEYRINTDGTFFTGWLTLEDTGEKRAYYGDDYAKKTGFFRVDGKMYYAEQLIDNMFYAGKTFEVDGRFYRMNADKSLVTGFYQVEQSSKQVYIWYYDETYVLRTGFFRVDGKKYYADPANTDNYYYGSINNKGQFTVDGDTYYAENDGSLRTGIVHAGDTFFAYDEEGKAIKNQFIERDEGMSRTTSYGTLYVGAFEVGDDEYYADKDGIIQTGVVYMEYGSQTIGMYYQADGRKLKEENPDTTYLIVEQNGNRYAIIRSTGRLFQGKAWLCYDKKEDGERVIVGFYYADEKGCLMTGFQEVNDKLYYLQEDGLRLDGPGFHEINGKTCYINKSNYLERSGWFYHNGNYYYANEDATVRTTKGWFEVGGKTYYLAEGGAQLRGFQEVDGKKYYFNDPNAEYSLLTNAWLSVRIEKDGTFIRYQKVYFGEDGAMKTGWFELDGELYYFTEDGLTYDYLAEVDGYTYMFNGETGKVIVRGDWYSDSYFDEKGRRASGLTKIGDDYYILSDNGKNINKNRWYTMDDGTVYRLDKDGKALKEGWNTVNGTSYYFNEDGSLANGLTMIDGKTYLLEVKSNNNIPTVTKKTGLQEVGEKSYYFNDEGEMVTGSVKIDGNDYLFGTDGIMQTGWQTIGGVKYYYDKTSGKKVTGEVTIDGKKYKFGTDGKFIEEVKPTTPEKPVTPSVKKGWIKTGSSWYFYKNNKALTGWQTISKKKYYFDSKGILQTGWKKLSGKWYYFSKASKNLGEMLTGWQKLDKKWYFFSKVSKTKGQMVLGWQKIAKKWYYFSKSSKDLGQMALGWKKIGKKWYHFSKASKTRGEMTLGWKKLSGKWYYFSKSTKDLGAMVTGWKKLNKKWYFFSKSSKTIGEMVTGWKKIDKKWHYFEKNGVMVAGKSKKIGKKTYKFNKDGVCLNK